jgi:hypothetical protein
MAQPLQPSEAIQMWFDYRNSHSEQVLFLVETR